MGTISLQLVCLLCGQAESGRQLDATNGRFSTPTVQSRNGERDLGRAPTNAFDNSRSGSVRSGLTDSIAPRNRSLQSAAPAYQERAQNRRSGAAERLLQRALNLAQAEADSQDTPLVDILKRNMGQAQRARAVRAYWQLATAIGEYRFAEDEERQLRETRMPTSVLEKALREAAIAAAVARTQEAKVAVLARQHRLVEEASMPVLSQLPWPADAPLVGAYRTKFENLFVGQPQPIRLYQIDRSLPHLLTRIEAQADAVLKQEEAMKAVLAHYRRSPTEVSLLLRTYENQFHQRRQFLAAVLEYNSQIADYAVTVAGPSIPPHILVSTLIATTPQTARARNVRGSAVRRMSHEELLESRTGQVVFGEVDTNSLLERSALQRDRINR